MLCGVFLFLLLFFGAWSAQLPHYALPLYPLLFLAAGRALSESGRFQRVLPVGLLALLLAVTLPGSIRFLKMISTPDTRLNALAWAREALPSGSRVLRFAHTPEFSSRDPFQVTVDWENHRLEKGAGGLSKPRGSITSSTPPIPRPTIRRPRPCRGVSACSGGSTIRPRLFPHDPAV